MIHPPLTLWINQPVVPFLPFFQVCSFHRCFQPALLPLPAPEHYLGFWEFLTSFCWHHTVFFSYVCLCIQEANNIVQLALVLFYIWCHGWEQLCAGRGEKSQYFLSVFVKESFLNRALYPFLLAAICFGCHFPSWDGEEGSCKNKWCIKGKSIEEVCKRNTVAASFSFFLSDLVS